MNSLSDLKSSEGPDPLSDSVLRSDQLPRETSGATLEIVYLLVLLARSTGFP